MSGLSISNRSNSYSRYNQYSQYSSHRAAINRANKQQVQPQAQSQVKLMCNCGVCPACRAKAGGGGGGGAVKKKKATGMSWNEAYYVYSKIQRLKMQAVEDKKVAEMVTQRNALIVKLESSKLLQRLQAMQNIFQQNIQALKAKVISIGHTVSKAVSQAVTTMVNTISFTVDKMIGVVNKMTAVIGEQLKTAAHNIKENVKKMLTKLLESQMLNRLITILNEKREMFQDYLLRKIESMKEKIRKFIDRLVFGQKQNKKDKKHQKGRYKRKKQDNS